MKKTFLFLFSVLITLQSFAQKKIFNETPEQKAKRMEWWQNDRFGMFIHWGLYAMPARGEWIKSMEIIPEDKYQQYYERFNPDLFKPKEWAKEAKKAGMKYAVLTTKHHEGFCLFDSKYTDYKATNTKAKRDLVKEFVDAFRAEGIRVGFYYSLIDWHHPDYTVDYRHPLRNKDNSVPEGINKNRDMAKYRQYMRNQLTELLTKYGKIDELWLDFVYKGKGAEEFGSVELIKMIRKLQPHIIINDRLGLKDYEDGGDFLSPEQVSAKQLESYRGKVWETCQTLSGPWGYARDNQFQKTDKQLLDLLITSVGNGGNLLLNVGPTARGEIDERATKSLDAVAHWMKYNAASIYGCTYAPAGFIVPEGTKLTYNPKTKKLYIHILEYPAGRLVLEGYRDKVKYLQFLHDSSEILVNEAKSNKTDLALIMPAEKPFAEVPVIEVDLK